MGIDVSHSLLVGANYEDLEEFIQRKIDEDEHSESSDEYPLDEQSVVEEYFESASPYYDSPLDEQFLGFRIPNFQEVDEDWWEVVKESARQFELLTGVKAKIRGGANVW